MGRKLQSITTSKAKVSKELRMAMPFEININKENRF
jgi:hypothetical protein